MLKRVDEPAHMGDRARLAIAIALICGAAVGFTAGVVGASGNPVNSAPVATYAMIRTANDLCAQGYSVWNDASDHICGPGGWSPLTPSEMRGVLYASPDEGAAQ